ncbi:platelet-activating factor receptor isoform X1 [Spea bombifrons]|uniref:platelet-activating factor receptor isoform X1 n=1 Tax=Spea bombifrons TaxID=233779 RepID=UPI00234AB865|nr:platelet-activating factor receptor isoform X1 [Spea bombifrons]
MDTMENADDQYKTDPCTVDSDFRYTLFTVSYSIIFIFGFITNCYVLWVFTRVYPAKRLSEIKIFMINLTVADLLFLMTLPLWISYYHHRGDWIMPSELCNVAGCLFFLNTYCSVAFLGVISFNRFQAVTKPVETAQSTARIRGICVSTAVWILIFSSSIYYLIIPGTNKVNVNGVNVTRCFEGYNIENRGPVAITHFILVGAFFVVFLIILVCNTVIVRTLLTQSIQARQSAEMKHRALWMVGTVTAVFVICFVPHHIVDGPWTLTVLRMWHEDDCSFRKTLNDAHQVTLCLMSTNCMLDPIIYCFLTKKFRKQFSERFKTLKSSRKCSRNTTETNLEGILPLKEKAHFGET